MLASDLQGWVKAVPFVPFRIRLNSGRTFEIRHPEMIKVGFTTVIVFTFRGEATDVYEKWDTISPELIESVEPIEATRSKSA